MANSPHESKRAVTMRLDRELVARVQRMAADRGETMTDLVIRAVTRELEAAATPRP